MGEPTTFSPPRCQECTNFIRLPRFLQKLHIPGEMGGFCRLGLDMPRCREEKKFELAQKIMKNTNNVIWI